jgi:hypothetical protein
MEYADRQKFYSGSRIMQQRMVQSGVGMRRNLTLRGFAAYRNRGLPE